MIQRAFTAEIPVRMDRLRVSTDEEERNTVLQDMAIDNSFDNIPLNYLSPSASPSPDEMIIRQRGKLSELIEKSATFFTRLLYNRSSKHFHILVTGKNTRHSYADTICNDTAKFTTQTSVAHGYHADFARSKSFDYSA